LAKPEVAVSCGLGSSASLSSRKFLEIVWHKELVVLQKNLHIPGVVRYLEADVDMWCRVSDHQEVALVKAYGPVYNNS
jgi:hypothetical protein